MIEGGEEGLPWAFDFTSVSDAIYKGGGVADAPMKGVEHAEKEKMRNYNNLRMKYPALNAYRYSVIALDMFGVFGKQSQGILRYAAKNILIGNREDAPDWAIERRYQALKCSMYIRLLQGNVNAIRAHVAQIPRRMILARE